MNRIKYNYSIISEYRTELMGIAIFWIMLCHAIIDIKNPILNLIKVMGYGGVDIFLMLSGMGLYYSYKKDNRLSTFYKRRVVKIFPIYIPIVFGFCLILYLSNKMKFFELLMNISTLSYWFNTKNRFEWYISAITMLYAIAPIILKYFFKYKEEKQKYRVIYLSIIFSVMISAFCIFFNISHFLIFTTRIPIFLIGILVGHLCYNKQEIDNQSYIRNTLILTLGLISLAICYKFYGIYLSKYGLYWWSFIFVTPPLCLLLSIFLKKIDGYISLVLNFLKFCGRNSLQLYLFHIGFFRLIKDLLDESYVNNNNFILTYSVYVISIVITYLCSKKFFINNVFKILTKYK